MCVKPYTFRIEDKTKKVLENLNSWGIPFSAAGILRAALEKELRQTLRIHQDKIISGFIRDAYAEILKQSLSPEQAKARVFDICSLLCASLWQNYNIRISPAELKRQAEFYFYMERRAAQKGEEIKTDEHNEIEAILGAEVTEDHPTDQEFRLQILQEEKEREALLAKNPASGTKKD
jgi:hypothetical protein